MFTRTILVIAFLCALAPAFAQVGINADGLPPHPDAMLDVSSTSKVFLPPRMTTSERDAIVSPPPGAQIYNTDIDCLEYFRGQGGWYSICPQLANISTSSVTAIGGTSAVCGGNVSLDGGAFVNARGVCWSLSPNPTVNDNYTEDGTGVGAFTSSLTALAMGTQYYVRAYATNSVGTAYGNELMFTTLELPLVETTAPTVVYGLNALCGGLVSYDGGAPVLSRGVCWSEVSAPTLGDSFSSSGVGSGSFESTLGGLQTGTQYFIRAYATNSVGTAYGQELNFTTTAGSLISFTSVGSTSWTVPSGVTTLHVLAVGGGGGGGGSTGGGGGAGGLLYYGPQSPRAGYSFPVLPGESIPVTVGGGGQGSQWATAGPPNATNGGNTVFGTLTAIGGGYGSSGASGGGMVASAGGSGGGGCLYYENVPNPMSPASGTSGQGNTGGTGTFTSNTSTWVGGGGGGAGGVGGDWNTVGRIGGAGGPGLSYSISGSAQLYAGGGGGAGAQGGGAGGTGGGGAGSTNGANGSAGVANTGGGGGGSDLYQSGAGGNGGSGVVIVRY